MVSMGILNWGIDSLSSKLMYRQFLDYFNFSGFSSAIAQMEVLHKVINKPKYQYSKHLFCHRKAD